MEVKSFLDIVDEMTENARSNYEHKFHDSDEALIDAGVRWTNKLINISVLYSMPFTKELILEIFKYWHQSEYNDFVNVKDNCVWFRGNEYTIRTDKNNPLTGTILPTPRTVDDFINDCHRVGIMLFWKEEIEHKFK